MGPAEARAVSAHHSPGLAAGLSDGGATLSGHTSGLQSVCKAVLTAAMLSALPCTSMHCHAEMICIDPHEMEPHAECGTLPIQQS